MTLLGELVADNRCEGFKTYLKLKKEGVGRGPHWLRISDPLRLCMRIRTLPLKDPYLSSSKLPSRHQNHNQDSPQYIAQNDNAKYAKQNDDNLPRAAPPTPYVLLGPDRCALVVL